MVLPAGAWHGHQVRWPLRLEGLVLRLVPERVPKALCLLLGVDGRRIEMAKQTGGCSDSLIYFS